MYSRILVPLDGSDFASQALPFGQLLAETMKAQLTLLEVIPAASVMMNEPMSTSQDREDLTEIVIESLSLSGRELEAVVSSLSPEQWDQVHRAWRQRALDRLNAIASGLQGLAVAVQVGEGNAAEAIVQEAKRVSGTLVVMATHGRSGVGRWLIGSVTDKVIRATGSPVLVIRGSSVTPPQPPHINRVLVPLDGSSRSEQALPHATALAKPWMRR